MKSLLQVSK